jgi:hypothetical protein
MRIPRIEMLALVLLTACGDRVGSSWTGTVTDSAGVAMVKNPSQGFWSQESAWSLDEDLRIGASDGAPENQFGTIVAIDLDSRGNIYVLDQQVPAIRVFDRDGEYLRTIGRGGGGPGELSNGVGAVLVGAGDTLFVPDIMLQRVNRFLPDGTLAGSYPTPFTDGVSLRWQSLADGSLVQQVSTALLPGVERSDQRNLVLLRGSDGSVRDTLLRLPVGEMFEFQGGLPKIRLFEAEALWEAGPDGRLFHGLNTEYRIEVRTLDGALRRVITRPFERLPLAEGDRRAFLDAMGEAYTRHGVPPNVAQQLLENVSFADHYPAYATMAAGPDGTLWVQRIRSAAQVVGSGASFSIDDVGSAEWEVFDAEGRYLGVVTFPVGFRPVRFHGDWVIGVWKDDMDIEYVMRLRVRRPL